METKDIILGTLLGAGGIGAALYFTGQLGRKQPQLMPPSRDEDETPKALPPPPPPPPVVVAPAPAPVAPVVKAAATPVSAEAALKPVAAAAPAAPAVDMAAMREEMKKQIEAEFAARKSAADKEAERIRLTGQGWTRSTARQGRGKAAGKQLQIPPGWDEAKYLAKYPDVQKALDVGAFPSGLAHYLKYGKKEGRTFNGFGAYDARMRRPGFLAGIFANWDWRF